MGFSPRDDHRIPAPARLRRRRRVVLIVALALIAVAGFGMALFAQLIAVRHPATDPAAWEQAIASDALIRVDLSGVASEIVGDDPRTLTLLRGLHSDARIFIWDAGTPGAPPEWLAVTSIARPQRLFVDGLMEIAHDLDTVHPGELRAQVLDRRLLLVGHVARIDDPEMLKALRAANQASAITDDGQARRSRLEWTGHWTEVPFGLRKAMAQQHPDVARELSAQPLAARIDFPPAATDVPTLVIEQIPAELADRLYALGYELSESSEAVALRIDCKDLLLTSRASDSDSLVLSMARREVATP